eukprot:TRINITY_DN455_c1_g1_i1.p2 TRINITY_DN455_c1_g1~~TRINITY_DN455_c1_g1_i1.p2  ORF type:complete len:377 (-),score=131.16 TRINITY_DN455_c1_g1_i1:162-1292(-)
MRAAIVVALLAVCAVAVKIPAHPTTQSSGLSLAEIQKFNALKETNMGRIIIGLAELHLKGDAPIKRLIKGLEDFVEELNQGIASENAAFETKRASHQATIQALNTRIGEAKAEIASRQSRINAVLTPRLNQAQSEIERDSELINQKRAALVEAANNREHEHNSYLERVNEHNEAITAIDEALPLLNGLKSATPSLIQTRKATATLKNVQLKLAKTKISELALVQALISLAINQNFVNQEILDNVISKFNDLRKRLADSLALEAANEAQAQSNYEAFVKQTEAEIAELTANINKNTVIISDTQREIAECNHVIDEKTFEIAELNESITIENENWRKETDTHNSIIQEYNREIDVVKQCQAIFNNAHFTDYVVSRLGN